MKLYLLLSSFILLFMQESIAQTSVKIGLGYTRFGPDGQKGITNFIEYAKPLGNRLSLAPSFQIAYGTKGNEFPYYLINKFSTGIDLNLFYKLLRSDQVNLQVGIGPALRYFAGRSQSYYYIGGYDGTVSNCNLGDGSYCVPLFTPKAPIMPHYVSAGYSAIVDIGINLNQQWSTGIRGSFQGYTSQETMSTVSMSTAYHF